MPIRRYDEQQRRTILQARLDTDIPFMVGVALKEDLGQVIDYKRDITGQLLNADTQATARIITRENGVFCGKQWLEEVFLQLGGQVKIDWKVQDGEVVTPNQVLCEMHGPITNFINWRTYCVELYSNTFIGIKCNRAVCETNRGDES